MQPRAKPAFATIIWLAAIAPTLVHAQVANGLPTPPPPAVPPPVVPPPVVTPSDADLVLRRVLRSGCRDGINELAQIASREEQDGHPGVASRVLVLCAQVRNERPFDKDGPPRASASDGELDQEGRAKLVFAGTIYGLWAGIALDIIAGLDDPRALVIPPLVGVGAGLGLSLLATRDREVTNGQSWTTITGFDYGSYSGLLWSLSARVDSERTATAVALGSGLAAGALAATAAWQWRPSAGDAEVLRSGGLWGFATGLLVLPIFAPEAIDDHWATSMAIGMDSGLIAGALIARGSDISRNRMLLIDAGTLTGVVAGFGFGFLATGTPSETEARLLGGATLAGMYLGMGAAIYLTRDMRGEKGPRLAASPGLLARGTDGRWGVGRLLLVPTVSPGLARGRKPNGAWVPLVGGAW